MTYFDPTPSEMLFRIVVSLTGLVLLATALTLRGIPDEPFFLGSGLAAIAFLGLSAGLSGLKLRHLRGG
jgi:hypothetical protein